METEGGRLWGKTAIVTGASRNIGRAIALRLAREGCDLVVTARQDLHAIEGLARDIEAMGRRALPLLVDVSIPADVARAAERVLDRFARIDVLVNNAAVRLYTDFARLTADEWHRIFDVNLHGPFYWCKAVIPTMVAQRSGSIINMNGTIAYLGGRHPAVVSSKSGLLGLTRSLAVEFGPSRIRANSIVLGRVDTVREVPVDPLLIATEIRQVPLGRLGTVQDVAGVCVFLASDDAAFITGQSIHVNGGRHTL